MKSSRATTVLVGLVILITTAGFFVLRFSPVNDPLSAGKVSAAFSPAMDREEIFETLRKLGITNFTHETMLPPGFWKTEASPEKRFSSYDDFAIDELSRTVSMISFNQAVGSDILSFSTEYLSGTFLLDSDEKLIAFKARSYNEGL